MKIVTYNLRFGGKGRVHWQEIIDRYDPDVLLVQESYAPAEHLPDDGEECCAVWSPAVGKNREMKWGSGVYAKNQSPRMIRIPKFQGWVVGAEVKGIPGRFAKNRTVRYISLHAPSGMGSYQKVVNQILDILLKYRDGCDLVIGGDFNLSVGERLESEDLSTSNADRKIQVRLRDEFGLVNCWQTANPNQPLRQTLRWTNQPEAPYHCDGIFVPRRWAKRLKSSKVISGKLWNSLSDHNPILAEIE